MPEVGEAQTQLLYQLVDCSGAIVHDVQFPRIVSAECADQESRGQQKIPLPGSSRSLLKTPDLSPDEVPENVLSLQRGNFQPAVYIAANDGFS